MNPFDPLGEEKPPLDEIQVRGKTVQRGSRVLLTPQRRADVFDLALNGKTATVEGIELDYDGRVFLAVTVDDDPGKDFGQARKIAHRFFFRPDEVEPIGE